MLSSLSDSQCALVMTAAGELPVEERAVFLQHIAAWLRQRSTHFTDADLNAAIQDALLGLPHQPVA